MSGTNTLTLYSYWRSSCAWRARIALNLKGLQYDYKPINLLKGEQNSEEYRKINKRGYVPTLIDGKDTIVESLAIIEYLDEKHHDKTPLLPSNLVEKAKVRAVALHIISGIQPLQNLGVIAHHSSDPAEKKKWAHHWINIGFQVLEKMLSESHGKFCFGDQITIADICIPPQVYNATRFDVDMSAFPIISQINDNLSKIEAFAKAHPSAQPDATE